MRGARIVLTIGLLALAGGAGATGALNPASPAGHCKARSTSATIGGKHVCLRAGARCTKGLDRQYHRYRFHCHSGRLTRFAAPPAPPPAAPPTLPEPPAPAGALVDVGGYRLHLECVGAGSPTVVFEAGAIATRHAARKVQYALSTETRVCSYDRPHTIVPVPSASDPRPVSVPSTSETFARELRTVLATAGERGPYLLAGASFGGLLLAAYLARYPDDVAGLVFLDAVGPGSVAGFARPGTLPELWDARADVDRIAGVSFGSRPVVVLTTTLEADGADIRRRGTNVLVAHAPQLPHIVLVEVPGLAYETVRVAVLALRSGGRLPACAATRLPAIGARCSP